MRITITPLAPLTMWQGGATTDTWATVAARQARKTIALQQTIFDGEDDVGTLPCLLILLTPLALLAGVVLRVWLYVG